MEEFRIKRACQRMSVEEFKENVSGRKEENVISGRI